MQWVDSSDQTATNFTSFLWYVSKYCLETVWEFPYYIGFIVNSLCMCSPYKPSRCPSPTPPLSAQCSHTTVLDQTEVTITGCRLQYRLLSRAHGCHICKPLIPEVMEASMSCIKSPTAHDVFGRYVWNVHGKLTSFPGTRYMPKLSFTSNSVPCPQ